MVLEKEQTTGRAYLLPNANWYMKVFNWLKKGPGSAGRQRKLVNQCALGS